MVRQKIETLARGFQECEKDMIGKSYGVILENPKMQHLFASLNDLMQYRDFYQDIFDNGFESNVIAGETHWRFKSPIIPLLSAFFYIGSSMVQRADWQTSTYVQMRQDLSYPGHPFYCVARKYTQSRAPLDMLLGQPFSEENDRDGKKIPAGLLIENPPQGETFLGVISVDTRRASNDPLNQFEHTLQTLKSTKGNATAIIYVNNGKFTEPLFLIKTGVQIRALGSQNPNRSLKDNAPPYTHDLTKTLFE